MYFHASGRVNRNMNFEWTQKSTSIILAGTNEQHW